jgi:hypothetical protein
VNCSVDFFRRGAGKKKRITGNPSVNSLALDPKSRHDQLTAIEAAEHCSQDGHATYFSIH